MQIKPDLVYQLNPFISLKIPKTQIFQFEIKNMKIQS